MINIGKQIKKIEDLLDLNSIDSITYAALEARLTIEMVCYERLKISYGYTSYADLRGWQPKAVVEQVVKEANDLAAADFKLSISTTPVNHAEPPQSVSEFEALEYVPAGTQVGINLREIGSLWQALSGIALHVRIPKGANDSLSIYGDEQAIKKKVNEALDGLRRIKTNSLLISGLGPEFSFHCDGCGEIIKRKINLIYRGMVATCPREDCNESYELKIGDFGPEHRRRTVSFPCGKCGADIGLPEKLVDLLRKDEFIETKCDACDEENKVALIPVRFPLRVSEI